MEFEILGWPPDGPTLRLDYRTFAYAGKFVMSNTGKAVARGSPATEPSGPEAVDGADSSVPSRGASGNEGGDVDPDVFDTDVAAAVAFNADRTDETTLWFRYIAVRTDAKGDGLGPRLAAFVAPRAAARGYERLRIAVNNPFAYEAMHKAGFRWTDRETGLAELVLERSTAAPAVDAERQAVSAERYQAGLDRFRERDLDESEAAFLRERVDADPPETVDPPTGSATTARRTRGVKSTDDRTPSDG